MVCKASDASYTEPQTKNSTSARARLGISNGSESEGGKQKQSGSECGGESRIEEVVYRKDKENCVGSKAGRNEGIDIYCRLTPP